MCQHTENTVPTCETCSTDPCHCWHVHIDARDFNHWDMRRLVMVYAKIEDALFAMVPEARRESRYCSPCGEAYLASINSEPANAKKAIVDATYPCLKGMAGKKLKADLDRKKGKARRGKRSGLVGKVGCRTRSRI